MGHNILGKCSTDTAVKSFLVKIVVTGKTMPLRITTERKKNEYTKSLSFF
jgi:hypothetical protein